MADVEILATQVSPAPLAYVIPGGQEILVKVLAANFDGSAAAVPWQPAIQLVGPSGQVLRTFPLDRTLAAGASADVTWFPGIGALASAGIRFNVDNEGGWLDVTTNNLDPGGLGVNLVDDSGGGIQVLSDNGEINVEQDGAGGIQIYDGGSGGGLNLYGNHGILINEFGGDGINIEAERAGNTVTIANTNSASGLIHVLQQGSGGITIEDTGSGGDILIHNTVEDNSKIRLLGTANSDPNPRLEITSPSSGTGDTMFLGNDNTQIKFLHGSIGSHVSVLGGPVSGASVMSENIGLFAGQSDGGVATHYENCSVAISRALMLHTTTVEPTGTIQGSDTNALVLYVYDDGSGHPKLKVWCPANGTRGLLFTG